MCLDTTEDQNETFNIALSNPTNGATLGATANANVRITDAEPTTTMLNSTKHYVHEGQQQTLIIQREFNGFGTATIDYSITSGTATGGAACTAGVDFIQQSGTLVMYSGMRMRSIVIETCPDSNFESVETANVQISNPVGTQLGDTASAQVFIFESNWQKQSSNPTGQTIEDLHMLTPLEGWAVGGYALILHTTDGGATWNPRQYGSGYKVHKIVATDARHAWAALEDGEIMKTTDGGKKWLRQKVYVGASPQDSLIAGIAFPNRQNGWSCIRGRIGTPVTPSILKTVDSGESWQDVNKAPAHNCFALDTFDGQTIVSVGFEGGGAPIVRSTDGADIYRRGAFGLTETNRTPYDFDGDGKADVGIFRPNGGEWWIQNSSVDVSALQFGSSTDKPVSADFTGDGKTDVALFRPSSGYWYILRSENNSFYGFPFGANGDVPVSADYDGDGKTDPAVFRNGVWYLQQSTNGVSIQQFGLTNDTPIPMANYR